MKFSAGLNVGHRTRAHLKEVKTMRNPILVVEALGVEKDYLMDGGLIVPALRGIDLTISRGEYFAIMGPSGSGKSTFLHIIACLDRPTRGIVKIEGVDISKMSDTQLADIRCRKIGFIFQTYNLMPNLTVLENVELPTTFLSLRPTSVREKAKDLLELVGIGNRMNHFPSALSAGERQRAAIARALINDPAVILADEPTGNLDSEKEEEVMTVFDKLNEKGTTLVIVTHNPEVAAHAENILRIRDGRIVGEAK